MRLAISPRFAMRIRVAGKGIRERPRTYSLCNRLEHVVKRAEQLIVGAVYAATHRRHEIEADEGCLPQLIHALLQALCPSVTVAKNWSVGDTGRMTGKTEAVVHILPGSIACGHDGSGDAAVISCKTEIAGAGEALTDFLARARGRGEQAQAYQQQDASAG